MKQIVLKLVGSDAARGYEKLDKTMLAARGIPDGAKEVRRFRDVAYGREIVSVVFTHDSFADVPPGGLIPEAKPVAKPEEKKPEEKKSKKQ